MEYAFFITFYMICQYFSYKFFKYLFIKMNFFVVLGISTVGFNTLAAPEFSNKSLTLASNLLSSMTLSEEIGQMAQVDSGALMNDKGAVAKYGLGSVLSGGSSDPADGNSPQDWLDMVNSFKAEALQTRLKIPLLYGIDAVHGHNNVDGAVIFPHHIGLGATHDPQLIEQAEHVTAEEAAGTGIR